jgi:hypothetical protein
MKKTNSKYSIASSLLLQFADMDKNAIIKNIIETENKFDPKYKTELCKKFQTTGKCPYGYKCRFAHGKEELIIKNQGKNYKKRFCKSFHEKGYCPYGSRCNFRHDEKTFNETNLSYYYLRLFLFKNYFSESSLNFLADIGSNLIKDRLPVFKSITQNLSENKKFNKIKENDKDDFFEINFERKYSQSTVSNTSYEDDKKLNLSNSNEINFTNFKSY